MPEYEFNTPRHHGDFQNPPFSERLIELTLKKLFGSLCYPHSLDETIEKTFRKWFGPIFYKPYIDTFNLKGNENVLDFGCGSGIESKLILKKLQKGGSLICLDTSKYWMKITKKRLKKYGNVNFLTGDICEFNIPDSSFDIICIIYVLHDIEPLQRQKTVKTLKKKLKKSGKIHIFEPTKYIHGISIQEIRELMENNELKEVKNCIKKFSYQGVYIVDK